MIVFVATAFIYIMKLLRNLLCNIFLEKIENFFSFYILGICDDCVRKT